jgi:hypothetical protein
MKTPMCYIQMLTGVIEGCVAIVSAAFCCGAVCCGRRTNTEIEMFNTQKGATTGVANSGGTNQTLI